MRNTTGGKKHKKQGNSANQNTEFVFADKEQNYGKVTKLLGHSKFEIMVFYPKVIIQKDTENKLPTKEVLFNVGNKNDDYDVKTLIGNARPRLKKKRMFANKDCFVIVSLRDFQEGVCDIIHVYKQNHVHILNKKKLIPSYSVDNEANEVDVEFETQDNMDIPKVPDQNKDDKFLNIQMVESSDEEEPLSSEIKYDDFGNII